MTLGIIPVTAGNQVIVTFEDHQEITTTQATFTFAGMNFGAPSSARYLAAFVSWVTAVTAPTVTIGGIIATQMGATVVAPSGAICAWFIALVPTGSSGTVVGTLGASEAAMAVSLYSVTGISSTTPHATASSNAAAPTSTLSVPVNSAILVGATAGASSTITSGSWAGATTDCFESYGPSNHFARSTGSLNVPNGNASLTATCTFSAASSSGGSFVVLSP